MKVLDTTALIDFTKGKKELSYLLEEEQLFTTQINMYEFIRGLFLRNIPSSSILEITKLFENILVLPLTETAIVRSAEIFATLTRKGMMIEDADCLIAGIALSNNIQTIVTLNKSHFERILGVKVETY